MSLGSSFQYSPPRHHHQETHNNNLQLAPPTQNIPDQLHHHQVHMRQLIICCAQLISRSDFSAAQHLLAFLSSHTSPSSHDSTDRLLHYFTLALTLRLDNAIYSSNRCYSNIDIHHFNLQSSYLSLNQITPFIRFCHLTANQAILEAIDQSQTQQSDNHQHYNYSSQCIHILDFNIMHGLQWPSLMQAIVTINPKLTLRITSIGTNLDTLRKTGDRLSNFANSLGLNFRFHPLLFSNQDNINDLICHLSSIVFRPNEILVVNFVLYLHRLLRNRENLCFLLRKIRTMNPKVVTLAEREANHNQPLFMSRFGEALKYYTAVFDSMEATLPPNSRERTEVEQIWFGREIADIVAAEGEMRSERHERFRSWEAMMRSGGFRMIPLSAFAVAQAKLLLRIHYPSQGYSLEVFNESFNLGWQNQPLFSVSSWH
uniref:scarecrow-like protein 18 n=1 Tax=Erigeron canadensis TaxID=72917 RepID=UPI001CB9437D|nr:scarecrow-like protein 18 [Erigeron canadensis]